MGKLYKKNGWDLVGPDDISDLDFSIEMDGEQCIEDYLEKKAEERCRRNHDPEV